MPIESRIGRWVAPFLATTAVWLAQISAAADGAGLAFNNDIAPILSRHCVSCHRPGDIAANVSLATYDAARFWAESIKQKVLSREMPPWPPDPSGSLKFRNDARLSQREINDLVEWVDAGARKGDEADHPPETMLEPWFYPGGREPDAVIALPLYTVPPTGEIPYIQQLIKVPYTEDKWIIAMQVRAGNRALLHHMGITEVQLPDGMNPEDVNAFAKVARTIGIPDGSLNTTHPAVSDPARTGAYDMLGVYTPGTTLELYGDDSAKLLKGGKNMYINFNVHYTTTGRTETDRTQLALWFRPDAPRHQLIRAPAAVESIIANGRELLTDEPGTKAEGTGVAIPPIPAYADNYELIGITAYTVPVTIYQFQPHAHMRAKDFKYVVVYPDGREQTVLTVPKYDFHWQMAYQLDQPLKLPAGSKLIVTAHYDNSLKNYQLRGGEGGDPGRRCGPDKVAYFRRQNQSWDEMFSPLVQYSVDGAVLGQGQSRTHGAPANVEAVGCLEREPSKTWVLTSASQPKVTPSQATSSAELGAAAVIPLGTRKYLLLGTDVFDPTRHEREKVAIKGVLISDVTNDRLNVSSLQTIAAKCH